METGGLYTETGVLCGQVVSMGRWSMDRCSMGKGGLFKQVVYGDRFL